MLKHSLTDTLNYLRGNTRSYEVPIVMSPNYTHYQFGEKYSLFEDLMPIEAKQELIHTIWKKDKENCIKKIYYRSSEDSGRNDTIFSSKKGNLSCERFCRYGFDQIVFSLKEGEHLQDYEIKNLNILENTMRINGSYLNQNCRSQIVSYEEILADLNQEDVYQTLTSFTTVRNHFPEAYQPKKLNDELRIFFRACDKIDFKWKGRTTLKLRNLSNEFFQDYYEARSNDYWDNVVDLEYFGDHFGVENKWNSNSNLVEEKYER